MALRELVLQMAGANFPIAVAAGVGDNFDELGTDAVHIAEVMRQFYKGDGALVLMDMGSAVLSAQMAMELIEADHADAHTKLLLCSAPMVEAALAGSVQASAGSSLGDVAREALAALAAKQSQLGQEETKAGDASQFPAVDHASARKQMEIEIVVNNPHGLHARPSANLVQLISQFQSDVQVTNVSAKRGPWSARSISRVSLLQAKRGDTLKFLISGVDAAEVGKQLKALAASHFGETEQQVDLTPPTGITPKVNGSNVKGVGASEGIAIGPVMSLADAQTASADYPPGTSREELDKLTRALAQVATDVKRSHTGHKNTDEIFAAQSLLLSDPELLDAVHKQILENGISAWNGWRTETLNLAAAYSHIEDAYLRERAADVRDLSERVLRALSGSTATKLAPQPPAILLTDELLPSEAMACDAGHVLGVIAREGSPTAHSAILIRTLGIPMVVGAGAILSTLKPDSLVAIDGATGEVWIDPAPEELISIKIRQKQLESNRPALERWRNQPGASLDGERIEVLANVSSVADAHEAKLNGAEGVGLLRTEFVYMDHRFMPSEEEQTAELSLVLDPLGDGPVVIRVPDIGADKPLAFLPSGEERNPFLGVRGLRLLLRNPAFFRSNLKAILRAGVHRDMSIMFPMVTSPEEMVQARSSAEAAHEELLEQSVPHRWPVKLGMMVEVPSAAILAERFAEVADFFSIGTNDLTQYVLASERGNAALSGLQDAAHPAVLRLIQHVCEGAESFNRQVTVCGEAASDPVAALLMVGVGVRSLSVRANQVSTIKAQMAEVSISTLRKLASQAMLSNDASETRQLVTEFLKTTKVALAR